MKYEEKDFEVLKQHVEEFMKSGPLGDIYLYFFLKPYPYNQTENALDTLRFNDVRKMLIDFLYKVSRTKNIEITRQTEELIAEIWSYGYPDKQRGLDYLKNLSLDICNMTKSVDYWEYEGMRLPGESEVDVVRRTYQEIKNPDKLYERLQFWSNYLERMQLKYEQEIQVAEVIVRLGKLLPDLEMPQIEEIKELVENKDFLNYQMYHDAIIYYVLKKEDGGETHYKGLAEYEQELILDFSISEGEVSEVYAGDVSADNNLFELLEDGYDIAAMTMDGHSYIWDEVHRGGFDSFCHKEGLDDYLIFCKEKFISAAAIKAATGFKVEDLFELVESERKGSVNKMNRVEKHTCR